MSEMNETNTLVVGGLFAMAADAVVSVTPFEQGSTQRHTAPRPTLHSALGIPLWHPVPPATPLYTPLLWRGEGPSGMVGKQSTTSLAESGPYSLSFPSAGNTIYCTPIHTTACY